MARTSSTTASSAGGARTRRVKAQQVMPAGTGAAELENGTGRRDAACAAGMGAAELPEAGAGVAAAESGGGAGVAGAAPQGAGVPQGLRLWLARARALGLTVPQVVFELHVRRGLPLLEVARVLGLGVEAVRELWLQGRAARAALAPQSDSDFALVREHISAALWQTVEATFPCLMQDADAEDDEDTDPPAPATPPMLSVRLKALDQLAKLYDLSLETRATGSGPLPYATPEDIADDVRLRVLEMHRRGGDE